MQESLSSIKSRGVTVYSAVKDQSDLITISMTTQFVDRRFIYQNPSASYCLEKEEHEIVFHGKRYTSNSLFWGVFDANNRDLFILRPYGQFCLPRE